MSYTLPPGTYVIGDPCYNLSDEQMDELIASSDDFQQEGTVTYGEGQKATVCAFFTAHGDGRFHDHSRFEYAVDAGIIGIIPIEVLQGETPDESTKVVKFKTEFECYDSAGTLVFGHIEINTENNEDGDEEDFDDNFGFGDLDHDF